MLQQEDDLEIDESSVTVSKGVLLTRSGVRKVINHFEKKLETQYFYEPLLKRVSYKRLFFEQIKHFRRVITGEEQNYRPLVVK